MTYSVEDRQKIATAIIEQMGGFGRLQSMVGAHSFIFMDSPAGIRFQFKGSKKANICEVTYLPTQDLYKLELFKYTPVKYAHCPVVYEIEGAYDDMLKPIFEKETGLYLSL